MSAVAHRGRGRDDYRAGGAARAATGHRHPRRLLSKQARERRPRGACVRAHRELAPTKGLPLLQPSPRRPHSTQKKSARTLLPDVQQHLAQSPLTADSPPNN
ncbi:hypothetical protein ACRAWF_32245 [Streptomyces sp. L7]